MSRVQEISESEAAALRARGGVARATADTTTDPLTGAEIKTNRGLLDGIKSWYSAEFKDKKRRSANLRCLTQLGLFVGGVILIKGFGFKAMGQFDLARQARAQLQAQQQMMAQ